MPTSRSDFLADPQIESFYRHQRIDLLAANAPALSDGRFTVYTNVTKKGQIEVVTGITPYVERRTDINTPTESFELIPPSEADGFFAFSPLKNGQTPMVMDLNLNSPKTAATADNNERQVRSGITNLSASPFVDAYLRYNPMFRIPVPSDVEFTVTFEILPASTIATGIPNPFVIGAAATKRVDFAGVIVSGVLMPQTLYDRLLANFMSNG